MSSAAFQNLIYALIQVIHNFGAAAVIGFAIYGLLRRTKEAFAQRSMFLGLAIAWAVQGATGAIFGVTSLAFYGKLPDIHGIAIFAVSTKMLCVVLGFIVALAGIRRGAETPGHSHFRLIVSFSLGAMALTAAAFLRWFS